MSLQGGSNRFDPDNPITQHSLDQPLHIARFSQFVPIDRGIQGIDDESVRQRCANHEHS